MRLRHLERNQSCRHRVPNLHCKCRPTRRHHFQMHLLLLQNRRHRLEKSRYIFIEVVVLFRTIKIDKKEYGLPSPSSSSSPPSGMCEKNRKRQKIKCDEIDQMVCWNSFLQWTLLTNAKMLKKPSSNNANDVFCENSWLVWSPIEFVALSAVFRFSSLWLVWTIWFCWTVSVELAVAVCVGSLIARSNCSELSLDFISIASRSKYSSKSSTFSSSTLGWLAANDADVDAVEASVLLFRLSANCFSYSSNSFKSISKPFMQNGFEKSGKCDWFLVFCLSFFWEKVLFF